MTPEQFASIRRYVGFDETGSRALADFRPLVFPKARGIVDDFYAAIQAHPDAVAAITGGEAQVERLKGTLIRWLDDVLLGPHDEKFLENHSRIGRVHVRIELPQEFMFTAMNRIREHLLRIADAELLPTDGERTKAAVNQILDIELAIMLDTFREDLLTKMRSRERLATIGQLSATIAHELRNPLGTIESSLFLLQKRMEKLALKDATLQKHHEKIAVQVRECTTIIHSLLDLARDRPIRRSSFRVAELVDAARGQVVIPEEVSLGVDVPPDLIVDGDLEQLRQAVANLLRNSVEALHGGGTITVSAARRGAGVHIDVSDDGPGIPPEIRERVFEVLFTTKSTGTGLGLALAQRVSEAHGGALYLEPAEVGTRVRLWLPDWPALRDPGNVARTRPSDP